MLRPEPMNRVLLIGPRDALDQTIENLYDLKIIHVVDYQEEDEILRIGKPLPKASAISEDLIKLRSISNILKAEQVKSPSEAKIETDYRQRIRSLEINIVEEDASRKKIESLLSDLNAQIEELAPYTELPLNLEMYRGYQNIEVFFGRISREIEGLEKASPAHELFRSKNVIAIFVPKENAEAVRDLLLKQGFSALELPKGDGDPNTQLKSLRKNRDKWQKRLEKVDERLKKLRERYAGFVLAAEKELQVEVEKAEAPLRFATSEHSFIIDGWVPTHHYEIMQSKLGGVGPIYISKIEEKEEEAPTLLKNAKPAKPFESLIHLYSTPNYKELDPTIILTLIFPIFFGFMIGDAGYGAVWLVLGILLLRKLNKGGFRDLVFAVTLGGFFSLIFGLFLFGEAFGMPLIVHATVEDPNPMSWENSLGIHIPIHSIFHKLESPVELILLSVIAAFIHLGIGFIFGIVNEWRHGKKHAIAKIAWFFILFGLFIIICARFARWPGFGRDVYNVLLGWVPQSGILLEQMGFMASNPIPFLALGMIIAGAIILIITESALAPIEIVGLFANMMSYSRLAGVAIAKAATAIAFNTIIFTAAAPGGAMIIVALVIGFLFHAIIFLLGAVSAGIQAIRLNYVEFFLKFFKGNGIMFRPFGSPKVEGA